MPKGHWLKPRNPQNYWSLKFQLYDCLECHQSIQKHQGQGLCVNCWFRRRYHNNKKYRHEQKQRSRDWMARHPEKTKEMLKKAGLKWYVKNRETVLAKKRLERLILRTRAGNPTRFSGGMKASTARD